MATATITILLITISTTVGRSRRWGGNPSWGIGGARSVGRSRSRSWSISRWSENGNISVRIASGLAGSTVGKSCGGPNSRVAGRNRIDGSSVGATIVRGWVDGSNVGVI